ncbi:MAG: hypothetical protein DRZ79_06395 [Candidatus Cloacimonadota bacterium]|nr:MAG: hypothetical protein DRZ79_06395 [Candidatus Cloacimonadota bacterium]
MINLKRKKQFAKRFTVILAVTLFTVLLEGTTAFVVNSVSQTLSELNIEQQQVNNDFAELGEYSQTAPNKMAFYENFAYVVITYENCIQKIDLESGMVRSYIYLEDSSSPNDILIEGNFAYVSGNSTNKVYKINLENEEVESSVNVGLAPQGLCVVGNDLFVANTGFNINDWTYEPGTLSVIDLNNFAVTDTIAVDLNPANMTVVNGKLHVVCTGNYSSVFGKVDIVNLQNYETENVLEIGSSPASIAFGNNGKVYLGNAWPAGVFVYDAETLQVEITPSDEIFLGGNQLATNEQFLAVIDAADYIQNSVVRFYDLQNHQLLYQMEVGVGATDVKFYEPTFITDNEINDNYRLYNYPNPFKNSTRISFSISNEQNKQNEQNTISIYNVKGQKIRTLECINQVDAKATKSLYSIIWNGEDNFGKKVGSGVYYYQLKTGAKISKLKKMIYIR